MTQINDKQLKMANYLTSMEKGESAFTVQPYSETNCKLGTQFITYVSNSMSNTGTGGITSGSDSYMGIKTPSDTSIILKRCDIHPQLKGAHGYLQVRLYENLEPTGVSDIVDRTINLNRQVANGSQPITSGCTLRSGAFSYATVSGRVTREIWYDLASPYEKGRTLSPIDFTGGEIILDKDTWYCFEFYNNTDSNVGYAANLSWYEGEPDFMGPL